MLKKILHNLLRHRHFWREVGFDELSEMYISMIFRGLSVGLTGIFVPIYMLDLGYDMVDVLAIVTSYFLFRATIFDLLAGWLTARFGPKHTIISSYVLLIISTGLFLTWPQVAWPIWLVGALWGGATSLFCIPFHVDFSKVKHAQHSGKEIGYVSIMEKFGGILGPLLGGITATIFGGQYIFLVSIFILFLGSMPLLRTREQVRLRQPLNYNLLELKALKRDILSFAGYGIELTIGGSLWPLYLGMFVLASGSAYALLGLLASASVISSISVAYIIGRVIDRRSGRSLLRFGVTANAILHIFRPFVTSYPVALLVNLVHEGSAIAYRLPYTKGFYDRPDDLGGHRIAYFVVMELTSSFAKAMVWGLLMLLSLLFTEFTVLTVGFMIGALASMTVATERFKAL